MMYSGNLSHSKKIPRSANPDYSQKIFDNQNVRNSKNVNNNQNPHDSSNTSNEQNLRSPTNVNNNQNLHSPNNQSDNQNFRSSTDVKDNQNLRSSTNVNNYILTKNEPVINLQTKRRTHSDPRRNKLLDFLDLESIFNSIKLDDLILLGLIIILILEGDFDELLIISLVYIFLIGWQ